MERIPGLKVIGDATKEVKDILYDIHNESFDNHLQTLSEKSRILFEKYEIKKTPEHFACIDAVNAETNRILIDLGLEPYNIPYDNYHILEPSASVFIENMLGGAHPGRQEIVISNHSSSICLTSVLLHETLHLKGILVIHVSVSGEGELIKLKTHRRRHGVEGEIVNGDKTGKTDNFHGLHEAIVAMQERISLPVIIEKIPFLKSEKDSLEKLLQVSERRKYLEKQGLKPSDVVSIENGQTYLYSYIETVKVLQYICDEVHNAFPDVFTTPMEVYREFLKAQFVGDLLPLGRFMKGVFGETAIRILAEMKSGAESAKQCLEKLKALRL